jgi:hypothetical protein
MVISMETLTNRHDHGATGSAKPPTAPPKAKRQASASAGPKQRAKASKTTAAPKRQPRKASEPKKPGGLSVELIQSRGITDAEAGEIKKTLEQAGVSVELTPNPNDDPLDGAGKPVTKERIRNLLNAFMPGGRKKISAKTQAEIDRMSPARRDGMREAMAGLKLPKRAKKPRSGTLDNLEIFFPGVRENLIEARAVLGPLATWLLRVVALLESAEVES